MWCNGREAGQWKLRENIEFSLCSLSPMDFAQPVSFKNADIGRCAHQKRPEEEDGAVTAETVIQPEPVPTPAPCTHPISDTRRCLRPIAFSFYLCVCSHFLKEVTQGYLVYSTARIRGRVTCLWKPILLMPSLNYFHLYFLSPLIFLFIKWHMFSVEKLAQKCLQNQ